ncbi:MAG: ABC transporter permease subunit [Anaerolineales bacterium]|nr:ABC transporter permease subunit [Anaerolineales bacterium]
MKDENKNGRSPQVWKTAVIILAIFLLYAYGLQITKVNLQEPLEPQRQENLIGLIRSFARPDIFDYETETRRTAVSLRMPCPEEIKGSQVSIEGRQLLVVPNCVTTTQDAVTITGSGFLPNAEILVAWTPIGSTSTRRVAELKASDTGEVAVTFTMPDVRPSEEPQKLELVEVVDRNIVGLSDTTYEALDKIVETVLMALMASTIGTLLSIPLSFIAARNLMQNVKAPMTGIMSGIILLPILGGGAFWLGRLLVGPILSLDGTFLPALQTSLTALGFVGNFIFVLIELIFLLLPLTLGAVGAFFATSIGGRFGQQVTMRAPASTVRILTLATTLLGTAVLFILLAYGLVWINVLGIREFLPESFWAQLGIYVWPGLVLGLIAALLTLRAPAKHHYPIGLVIYNVTRTIFNAVRSIEPLMMGFVFVVWVGLGPFAGIMALTLHSMADLGKLFSEEVENIDEGPVEAITATGANQLQRIVYAVVPQVTPHYIAYIFYRWDINVRMSTIIGFVGGGGIGFVLQRNINQILYTRASVMVIAIAIVVVVLDNISARVRSRII